MGHIVIDPVTRIEGHLKIDAVEGGGEPGSVYRFRAGDVEQEGKCVLSMHQIGLLEDLEMMEYMGDRPKDTVIIGVEPKEIGWGARIVIGA